MEYIETTLRHNESTLGNFGSVGSMLGYFLGIYCVREYLGEFQDYYRVFWVYFGVSWEYFGVCGDYFRVYWEYFGLCWIC